MYSMYLEPYCNWVPPPPPMSNYTFYVQTAEKMQRHAAMSAMINAFRLYTAVTYFPGFCNFAPGDKKYFF